MPAHTFVWHQGAWARYSDAAQHFFLCWVRPHSAEDAGEDEYLVMWHDTHGTDWVRASDMVPLDKVTSSVYQQIAPEQKQHIVAVLAIYRCSTMAQTGVSGPVVVDGESFLDALFASAGQG